jgi:hypothetical protein
MQRDPIEASPNLYAYVADNPICLVDSYGFEEAQTAPVMRKHKVAISVHGSRHSKGKYGDFDGRASSQGGGKFEIVDTGAGLLAVLAKYSGDCDCIERLYINSHALGSSISMRWDSGFYVKKPDKIGPMPEEDKNAETEPRPGAARDVKDLDADIKAGKIVFCKPCEIRLYGCWTGRDGMLAQALSRVTPCTVYGAAGRVAPVIKDGKETGEFTSEKPGWRSWKGGGKLDPSKDPNITGPNKYGTNSLLPNW